MLSVHDELNDELGQYQFRRNALRRIYDEAMASWESSKKPTKTLTTQHADPNAVLDDAGKGKSSGGPRVVVKDSRGDHQFLEIAMRALDDIGKIDAKIKECRATIRRLLS